MIETSASSWFNQYDLVVFGLHCLDSSKLSKFDCSDFGAAPCSTISWTTRPIKCTRWIRFLWWFCSIFLRFWTSQADIPPEKIFVSCKFPHKKFFWPFQKMSILKYIFWNSCFWTKPEKLCKPYKFFARQKCFYGPSIKWNSLL